MYDIAIIGGGTAGLTAAIYGQRAGKKTVVLEGKVFGGQISYSHRVENYPGIAAISGSEFTMNLLEQAKALGAEIIQEQVTGVESCGEYRRVHTGTGNIPCKTIIIASGVNPRKLGFESEEKLIGAGVSYCATCDGAFFKNMDVAVVGGGSTALEDAEFLSNYCSKVYLIHRRDEFRGEEKLVEALLSRDIVQFLLSCTVNDINGKGFVEGLNIHNIKTGEDFDIEVAGLFVAIGQVPENQIFADLVELDDSGFIVAGEECLTSAPGIFAAGDCRTKSIRQLTTAAADGSVAALAATKFIATEITY